MEERKNNKGVIVALLTVVILCLAGYIVYDKVLSKNLTPVVSSTPLNETFKTSKECADESDNLFLETGIHYKPAKELSVNRTNLIKSSYPLSQAYYCYDMDCQEKEMTGKELEEYKNETDGYGLIIKVAVSDGVATIYDYDRTGKLEKTQKINLQGVKGVSATFSCADGYGILVLDKNNDLYLVNYEDEDDDLNKHRIWSTDLIYKNVKDFSINDIPDGDVFGSYEGCRWDTLAIHTLDGKSVLINGLDPNDAVDLSNVTELTTYWKTGVGVGKNVFVSTSTDNTYQKYNGEEIKVKGLFTQDAKQNDDYEIIDYGATIHLVTDKDEHLYYRFDDCEHKYRLYTNRKVKSLEYDTNRKKAIMTYTDGNKVEFDYSDKIELK